MKKLIAIAITLALASIQMGCASVRSVNAAGEIVTTGSRCYDADVAAKAGLDQAATNICEAVGRGVFWKEIGNTAGGAVNCVKAGNAYEACVAGKRAQAR